MLISGLWCCQELFEASVESWNILAESTTTVNFQALLRTLQKDYSWAILSITEWEQENFSASVGRTSTDMLKSVFVAVNMHHVHSNHSKTKLEESWKEQFPLRLFVIIQVYWVKGKLQKTWSLLCLVQLTKLVSEFKLHRWNAASSCTNCRLI